MNNIDPIWRWDTQDKGSVEIGPGGSRKLSTGGDWGLALITSRESYKWAGLTARFCGGVNNNTSGRCEWGLYGSAGSIKFRQDQNNIVIASACILGVAEISMPGQGQHTYEIVIAPDKIQFVVDSQILATVHVRCAELDPMSLFTCVSGRQYDSAEVNCEFIAEAYYPVSVAKEGK